MAITTTSQALAGMQPPRQLLKAVTPTLVVGHMHSSFYQAGNPGAGAASAAGLNGEALTAPLAGCIPFTNPVSGNSYLARLQAAGSQAGTLFLCDRLWQNVIDLTTTSPQAITAVGISSRDANGSNLGDQIMGMLEISTLTGAGAPVIDITYTNQAGATGKVGAGLLTGVTLSAIGASYLFTLAAGDSGIRAMESITLASSAWAAPGAGGVVLFRVLATLDLPGAYIPNAIDMLTSGFPKIYNGSCLFTMWLPAVTTAMYLSGHVIWSQG